MIQLRLPTSKARIKWRYLVRIEFVVHFVALNSLSILIFWLIFHYLSHNVDTALPTVVDTANASPPLAMYDTVADDKKQDARAAVATYDVAPPQPRPSYTNFP